MAARCIERESKKVSDSVNFKWKIKNFTVEDLPRDDSPMMSPSFQCLKAFFRLEISHKQNYVCLKLKQNHKASPLWISDCTLGLTYSDKCDQHVKQFSAPTKLENITCSFAASEIRRVPADSVLYVCCNFTALTLVHITDDESDSESEEDDEDEFSNSGPLVLAGDIEKAFEHYSLSDVTVKVGKDEFEAHKIILASRSKVFDAMFETDMKENQENVVDILEMQPSIAKEMMQYIYTGKIENLSMNRALDLYVAADRYDLPELKKRCKRFIQKHISAKDVCQVAELAELHNDKQLAKTARRMFKEQSKKILVSKEWRDFAENNPTLYTNLMEGTLLNES